MHLKHIRGLGSSIYNDQSLSHQLQINIQLWLLVLQCRFLKCLPGECVDPIERKINFDIDLQKSFILLSQGYLPNHKFWLGQSIELLACVSFPTIAHEGNIPRFANPRNCKMISAPWLNNRTKDLQWHSRTRSTPRRPAHPSRSP